MNGLLDDVAFHVAASGMEDYLMQAMTYRTSPNGVFGIKIHYQALETDFIKAGRDPASLFPGLR